MPPLVQRYIKTSFVFFLLGLLVGGGMSVGWGILGWTIPHLLITAHVHLLLVGFVVMLVMGVATWMFPRPSKDDKRYRPELAALIYWILTLATALRFSTEMVVAFWPSLGLKPVITLGSIGQLLAACLFVVNMWSRVRAPSIARETQSS
jgi:cbb3-type cytochrome oxidase subunit 1